MLEPPPVPAANYVSKFTANRSAWAFATASPVSVGQAVSSRRWPASPPPTEFSAPQPSTCALATRDPGSGSGSVPSAGQRCSTPKKETHDRLPASQWEPLPTRIFRHLEFQFMTVAGIRGCSCRQGQGRMTRIPADRVDGSQPGPSEVRPAPTYGAGVNGRTSRASTRTAATSCNPMQRPIAAS